MHAVLSFVPMRDNTRVETSVRANPAHLSWHDELGSVQASFETTDTIRIRGRGLDLKIADAVHALTPFTGTYFFQDPTDESYVFTSYETGRRYRVTAINGTLLPEGAEKLGVSPRSVTATGEGEWEVAVEEYETARPRYSRSTPFEGVVVDAANQFSEYLEAIAGWRSERTPAAELAAYVLWSATVEPRGFLRRESILMSKHWMDKVWSWDHCFNALALARGLAGPAIDQFRSVFDHQDSSGALPDSVAHSEILYNFVKPPIHGWALKELRARLDSPIEGHELHEIYMELCRWSRFWLDSRRVPGHSLPHYQHGNDSGWDNSTTFDNERVIEAPDLAAFLLIQLQVLGDLATELGRDDESASWQGEADQLRSALLTELWDEDGFFAINARTGEKCKRTSLLNLLPILAADHLPKAHVDLLEERIKSHVTEWGPATQLPGTPEYEDDGYWRGPIWAPSTILIEDGLRRAGFSELADEISFRFLRLCEKSGFAENFDARTGAGLRDRAYTWTASSYLMLAEAAVRRATTVSPMDHRGKAA